LLIVTRAIDIAERPERIKIQAFLFHKVYVGNIYSVDLACSDKPLNIRNGIKALFLK